MSWATLLPDTWVKCGLAVCRDVHNQALSRHLTAKLAAADPTVAALHAHQDAIQHTSGSKSAAQAHSHTHSCAADCCSIHRPAPAPAHEVHVQLRATDGKMADCDTAKEDAALQSLRQQRAQQLARVQAAQAQAATVGHGQLRDVTAPEAQVSCLFGCV